MIKSFGVKEAKLASKFATTPEARRTVLATMAMLGITNKIAKGIREGRSKAITKIGTYGIKIKAIRAKLHRVKEAEAIQEDTLRDLSIVEDTWNL